MLQHAVARHACSSHMQGRAGQCVCAVACRRLHLVAAGVIMLQCRMMAALVCASAARQPVKENVQATMDETHRGFVVLAVHAAVGLAELNPVCAQGGWGFCQALVLPPTPWCCHPKPPHMHEAQARAILTSLSLVRTHHASARCGQCATRVSGRFRSGQYPNEVIVPAATQE